MAKRYIPSADFVVGDKKGRRRRFSRNHIRADGSAGYTKDELVGLYRDHLSFFTEVEVSGETIEQATAAPGEKRSTRPKKSTAITDA